MRYALTFTTDDTWTTTDTLLVETDISLVDMADEQIATIIETYTGDSDQAKAVVAERERWFCRNLEDTDVNMVGQ